MLLTCITWSVCYKFELDTEYAVGFHDFTQIFQENLDSTLQENKTASFFVLSNSLFTNNSIIWHPSDSSVT
jgi:hypothetical protein